MVVIGIVIGAGLVLGTLYLSGSLPAKTITAISTQTEVQTTITSTTVTITSISTSVITFQVTLSSTFSGGQNLQLVGQACGHNSKPTTDGHTAANTDSCLLAITNTGTDPATITDCSIYGTAQTLLGGTVVVPAGTTSASPVIAECDSGTALTPGAQVSGQLVAESGSPLSFSAISGP